MQQSSPPGYSFDLMGNTEHCVECSQCSESATECVAAHAVSTEHLNRASLIANQPGRVVERDRVCRSLTEHIDRATERLSDCSSSSRGRQTHLLWAATKCSPFVVPHCGTEHRRLRVGSSLHHYQCHQQRVRCQ